MSRLKNPGATPLPVGWLTVLATIGLLIQVAIWPAGARAAEVCETVGAWLDPKTGARMTGDQVLGSAAERKIVLLGESHTSLEDHLWQLHSLAGLHAHEPRLVVGFEMFPRAVQPALDDWSQGRSDVAAFLEESRWQEVWGYGAELYLPLFHFVRQNRLHMVAINVDRQLISRVGRDGWQAIPEDEREGLSDPAPASTAYRRSLAEVYAEKFRRGIGGSAPHGHGDDLQSDADEAEPDISKILESDGFNRFVAAQLTWDRAMAEALFDASKAHPDAVVVGILGRGHVEHGYGVPHQLADLGEDGVSVLLPIETGASCESLGAGVADAVFLVESAGPAPSVPAKPRLGVVIEQAKGGVRVLDIADGSVAQAAGIEAGDIIVSAASFSVSRVSDLIEIVQRQAPGTLLPLELQRDGERHRLVAEFPQRFD